MKTRAALADRLASDMIMSGFILGGLWEISPAFRRLIRKGVAYASALLFTVALELEAAESAERGLTDVSTD